MKLYLNTFFHLSLKLLFFLRKRCNQVKNRYTDVLCFDRTRVVLAAEDEEGTTDYINANYVDGYKQKRAFISTQGRNIISGIYLILQAYCLFMRIYLLCVSCKTASKAKNILKNSG